MLLNYYITSYQATDSSKYTCTFDWFNKGRMGFILFFTILNDGHHTTYPYVYIACINMHDLQFIICITF